MRSRVPLEWITEAIERAWVAVDAMWRVEIVGDAPLVQQWRVARNELTFARQRLADLERLAQYIAADVTQQFTREASKPDDTQPAPSRRIRPDRATRRPSAQVSDRAKGRTPSQDHKRKGRR